MLDQFYAYVDGQSYTLDGISGTLTVERDARGITRLLHTADAKGRGTDTYRERRRQLGDDYSSELPGDLYGNIAVKLGFAC